MTLEILRNEDRISHYFNIVGCSFQMIGATTEKSHLPRFSLVRGTESRIEGDDLSCLVMFDRCTTLVAK